MNPIRVRAWQDLPHKLYNTPEDAIFVCHRDVFAQEIQHLCQRHFFFGHLIQLPTNPTTIITRVNPKLPNL